MADSDAPLDRGERLLRLLEAGGAPGVLLMAARQLGEHCAETLRASGGGDAALTAAHAALARVTRALLSSRDGAVQLAAARALGAVLAPIIAHESATEDESESTIADQAVKPDPLANAVLAEAKQEHEMEQSEYIKPDPLAHTQGPDTTGGAESGDHAESSPQRKKAKRDSMPPQKEGASSHAGFRVCAGDALRTLVQSGVAAWAAAYEPLRSSLGAEYDVDMSALTAAERQRQKAQLRRTLEIIEGQEDYSAELLEEDAPAEDAAQAKRPRPEETSSRVRAMQRREAQRRTSAPASATRPRASFSLPGGADAAAALAEMGGGTAATAAVTLRANAGNAQWTARHGAMMGVSEILRRHGGAVATALEGGLAALLVHDALCLLALDRFSDFHGDAVAAPVREEAARVLAAAASLADGDVRSLAWRGALQLAESSDDWQTRHAGYVAVGALMARGVAGGDAAHLFRLGIAGARDRDDDVCARGLEMAQQTLSAGEKSLALSAAEAVLSAAAIAEDDSGTSDDEIGDDADGRRISAATIAGALRLAQSSATWRPGAALRAAGPFVRHASSSVRHQALSLLLDACLPYAGGGDSIGENTVDSSPPPPNGGKKSGRRVSGKEGLHAPPSQPNLPTEIQVLDAEDAEACVGVVRQAVQVLVLEGARDVREAARPLAHAALDALLLSALPRSALRVLVDCITAALTAPGAPLPRESFVFLRRGGKASSVPPAHELGFRASDVLVSGTAVGSADDAFAEARRAAAGVLRRLLLCYDADVRSRLCAARVPAGCGVVVSTVAAWIFGPECVSATGHDMGEEALESSDSATRVWTLRLQSALERAETTHVAAHAGLEAVADVQADVARLVEACLAQGAPPELFLRAVVAPPSRANALRVLRRVRGLPPPQGDDVCMALAHALATRSRRVDASTAVAAVAHACEWSHATAGSAASCDSVGRSDSKSQATDKSEGAEAEKPGDSDPAGVSLLGDAVCDMLGGDEADFAAGVRLLACVLLPRLDAHVGERGAVLRVAARVVRGREDAAARCASLLLVPVLRRVSDADAAVRAVAAPLFASLLRLLPLAETPRDASLAALAAEAAAFVAVFVARGTDDSAQRAAAVPAYDIPISVDADLRPYQRAGIAWLSFLGRCGLGAALCDDMGLGKTLQAAAAVGCAHAERAAAGHPPLPSLVVCPSSLLGHWRHEVGARVPGALPDVLVLGGPARERRRAWDAAVSRPGGLGAALVVCSYEGVRADAEMLGRVRWHVLVLDEGHAIRNARARTTLAVKSLAAERRVLLSGTPVQNSVGELWSLFDFLNPGLLGSEADFAAAYGRAISAVQPRLSGAGSSSGGTAKAGPSADDCRRAEERLDALHRTVLPFVLRRMKEDVLRDLPPKTVVDVDVDMAPVQAALYRDAAAAVEAGGDRRHVFARLKYLSRLCVHPSLVLASDSPSDWPPGAAEAYAATEPGGVPLSRSLAAGPKLGLLAELLGQAGVLPPPADDDDCAPPPQHKALVFAQHRATLDLVEALVLRPRRASFLRLDGSVDARARFAVAQTFNADASVGVLLLTTQVGGLGLNLTAADTVLFVEHDWNPMRDLQAMDRAHRLGQRRAVSVYRLMVRDSLEQHVLGLQRWKTRVAGAVVRQQVPGARAPAAASMLDVLGASGVRDKAADAKAPRGKLSLHEWLAENADAASSSSDEREDASGDAPASFFDT